MLYLFLLLWTNYHKFKITLFGQESGHGLLGSSAQSLTEKNCNQIVGQRCSSHLGPRIFFQVHPRIWQNSISSSNLTEVLSYWFAVGWAQLSVPRGWPSAPAVQNMAVYSFPQKPTWECVSDANLNRWCLPRIIPHLINSKWTDCQPNHSHAITSYSQASPMLNGMALYRVGIEEGGNLKANLETK